MLKIRGPIKDPCEIVKIHVMMVKIRWKNSYCVVCRTPKAKSSKECMASDCSENLDEDRDWSQLRMWLMRKGLVLNREYKVCMVAVWPG